MTVVRTLIDLTLVTISNNLSGLVHMGIFLCEGDAAVANIFPEPGQTADDPGWLWQMARRTFGTVNLNDSSQWTRIVYDIRAMRKWPGEDYELELVVDNDAASGSAFNVDGMVKVLLLRA